MAVINEWTEAALEQRREWAASVLLRALRRIYGEMPSDIEEQVRQLSASGLDELADALPSISAIQDLQAWLARSA